MDFCPPTRLEHGKVPRILRQYVELLRQYIELYFSDSILELKKNKLVTLTTIPMVMLLVICLKVMKNGFILRQNGVASENHCTTFLSIRTQEH